MAKLLIIASLLLAFITEAHSQTFPSSCAGSIGTANSFERPSCPTGSQAWWLGTPARVGVCYARRCSNAPVFTLYSNTTISTGGHLSCPLNSTKSNTAPFDCTPNAGYQAVQENGQWVVQPIPPPTPSNPCQSTIGQVIERSHRGASNCPANFETYDQCEFTYNEPSFDCVNGCQYDRMVGADAIVNAYTIATESPLNGYYTYRYRGLGQQCQTLTITSASGGSSPSTGTGTQGSQFTPPTGGTGTGGTGTGTGGTGTGTGTGGTGTGTGGTGTGTGGTGTGTGGTGTGTGTQTGGATEGTQQANNQVLNSINDRLSANATVATPTASYNRTTDGNTLRNAMLTFQNDIEQTQWYSGINNFFNVSISGGSCGGMNGNFEFLSGSFNVNLDDVFCGPNAQTFYSILSIGVLLTASFVAFRWAFY